MSQAYKIGDQIIITKNYDAAQVGYIGKLVAKVELSWAIEFSNWDGGHWCGGRCKHGQYVKEGHFKHYNNYIAKTVEYANR